MDGRGRIFDGDYEYSGQWFNDLGAGVLMSLQSPVLGYNIANTPGISRDELNQTLIALQRSGYNPYKE